MKGGIMKNSDFVVIIMGFGIEFSPNRKIAKAIDVNRDFKASFLTRITELFKHMDRLGYEVADASLQEQGDVIVFKKKEE